MNLTMKLCFMSLNDMDKYILLLVLAGVRIMHPLTPYNESEKATKGQKCKFYLFHLQETHARKGYLSSRDRCCWTFDYVTIPLDLLL